MCKVGHEVVATGLGFQGATARWEAHLARRARDQRRRGRPGDSEEGDVADAWGQPSAALARLADGARGSAAQGRGHEVGHTSAATDCGAGLASWADRPAGHAAQGERGGPSWAAKEERAKNEKERRGKRKGFSFYKT